MRPQTADERIKARYIPKNALPIHDDDKRGVVYVYPFTGAAGARYGVIAFVGTASKSAFHYTYKTDAQVDAKIAEFFAGLKARSERVTEYRARQYSGHTFKAGDIVSNSWGYDQTNVDWYVVVKTSANYVWLKEIHSKLEVDGGCGPMSGQSAPALSDTECAPIVDDDAKLLKHRASGDNVTMRHGCGSKWTGGTKYESWYA